MTCMPYLDKWYEMGGWYLANPMSNYYSPVQWVKTICLIPLEPRYCLQPHFIFLTLFTTLSPLLFCLIPRSISHRSWGTLWTFQQIDNDNLSNWLLPKPLWWLRNHKCWQLSIYSRASFLIDCRANGVKTIFDVCNFT